MSNYTIEKDGDFLEQNYWPLFIKNIFSYYEKFWQKFIVPLTCRPNNIHFKEDVDLRVIGKSINDTWIAQLHYAVLFHLSRVYDLRHTGQPLNKDQFIEAFVRLSSATDVADELLERYCNNNYLPGLSADSRKARKEWRQKNKYPLQHIREYRNYIVHAGLLPNIVIIGSNDKLRFPKISKYKEYSDWRKVTNASIGSGGKVRSDFNSPNNILDEAWKEVLDYFNTQWQSVLLEN